MAAAISIQCINRPPSRLPSLLVSLGSTSSVISTWDAFTGLIVARAIWFSLNTLYSAASTALGSVRSRMRPSPSMASQHSPAMTRATMSAGSRIGTAPVNW